MPDYLVSYCLIIENHIPVCGTGREKIAFNQGKCGNYVAQDIGTPQERNPVVKNDGRWEEVEVIGICKPKHVGNDPSLKSIDFILIHYT